MKVTLLAQTPNALEVMYLAARTCYSKEPQLETSKTKDEIEKFLNKVLASGHLSVAEHINYTFLIEGISRVASHQLVRHRHASYSQQSQRYVTYDSVPIYEPDSILKNREADALFNKFLDYVEEVYKMLIHLGIPAEDARYVLTNATTSNISITLNLRELIHICNLRLCIRAQKEIRDIIKAMADTVVEKEPYLKKYLVPKCDKDGFCTEEKCCGRNKRCIAS